jgi:hypothetical protein
MRARASHGCLTRARWGQIGPAVGIDVVRRDDSRSGCAWIPTNQDSAATAQTAKCFPRAPWLDER